jgi:hypothetical protein
VGNAVTCNNTQKRNKQVCFGFVFRSAPLPSPCSDLLLSLQVFLFPLLLLLLQVAGGTTKWLPVCGRFWVVAAAGGCSGAAKGGAA